MYLKQISPDVDRGFCEQYGCVLVSAVSFERRGTATSKRLKESGIVPTEHYVFDYDTVAVPRDEDEAIRQLQREYYETCFRGSCRMTFLRKNPAFSFSRLVLQMTEILAASKSAAIYIDISCLTRVHLLAIVTAVTRVPIDTDQMRFAYTPPMSYAFEGGSQFGWRDVLHVPIGRPRQLTREGHALGVVLTGHEGERLAVALEELEPGSGIVVFSNTPGRPDFLYRSEEVNRGIVGRLRTLSVDVGLEGGDGKTPGWSIEIADVFDADKLSGLIDRVVLRARDLKAPLILYPFGPKVHTVVAAMKMACARGLDTWVVYPVPTRFQVHGTIGIGPTTFFTLGSKAS